MARTNRWGVQYRVPGQPGNARRVVFLWPKGKEPAGIHRVVIVSDEVVVEEGEQRRVITAKAVRFAAGGAETFLRRVTIPKSATDVEVIRL